MLLKSHCYFFFFFNHLGFVLVLQNITFFGGDKSHVKHLELGVVEGLHAAVSDFNFQFASPSGAHCHQTSIQS